MSRLLRVLAIVVLALGATYGLAVLLARPRAPGPLLRPAAAPPLVLAHRGGRGLWPENTLYAFERAQAMGADWLELDLHLSRDGVPVAIHDATVDRTTDGSGAVSDFGLAELQALDAGYRWSPDDGRSHPYRGLGIRIPTLEELFAALPDARFVIEIKPDGAEGRRAAAAVCELLRGRGRGADVVVGSFHADALAAFRRACPEVASSATPGEVRALVFLTMAGLGRAVPPAASTALVPPISGRIAVVTPEVVAAAHRKGVALLVWTIDDEPELRRFAGLGVDGVITDRPDRALRVFGREARAEVPAFVTP